MPTITLSDGSQRQFDHPVTVAEVAADIGPGLAKAALAGRLGTQLVDTSFSIADDTDLVIITDKDPEGLEIIRHSTAHLLAHAVKSLFPEAQITIGPVVEDGFYYDIAYDARSFVPEDLVALEKKMQALAKADYPVIRKVLTREAAIALFEGMGEHYKVEIIRDLPAAETLTVYEQDTFVDLCRGPHVPRTGLLKAFTLTKLAGAYWRGDSNNAMLQRIYGTAWPDKKALKAYLHRIEEAKKRDHRELAKKMGLYHLQAEAPGQIFWHPNGWQIIKSMRAYLREQQQRAGYQEINTPVLVDEILWEQSGHKAKFDAGMFVCPTDDHNFLLKPMSCPCHVQIFKQGIKSYRDLPIRYAEFGHCHRNEPSGTLHGLMRVRGLVQDDGHIFCTEAMIQEEVVAFIRQLQSVYHDFGLDDITYKLSLRPEKRVGDDAVWDAAEKALADAMQAADIAFEELPGEGAFYGPKIEIHFRDCLGRGWQLGTMQVDFSTPDRLGAHYIAEDGSKQVPVMLHRAILGSFERFLAILLEHYAGHLPVWLAPNQVVIMGVADRHQDRVREIAKNLQNLGLRAISDLRNEKIGFKIREHTIARIPYQVVIGDRELADGNLAVRALADKAATTMTLEVFARQLQQLIEDKRRLNH